jgi:hypothetical protein
MESPRVSDKKKGRFLGRQKTVRLGWIDGRKVNGDVKVRKEWFYRGDRFGDTGKPFIRVSRTRAPAMSRGPLFLLFYLPLKWELRAANAKRDAARQGDNFRVEAGTYF